MLEQMAAKMLPLVLRQLGPDVCDVLAAVAEIAAGADGVGAPEPPPAVRDRLELAAVEHNLPPALLAAVSYELTDYRPDFRADLAAAQIARRRGVDGLSGAVLSLLREMEHPEPVRAAGAILGTFAVLMVRQLDAATCLQIADAFSAGE